VRLSELAERLGCRLEGDGTIDITRVAGLEAAGPGDVSFFSNARYLPALRVTRASAVILADDAPAAPAAMLRARNPYLAFARALDILMPAHRPAPGIHPSAVISATASLGAEVSIGPFAVIEDDASLGDRVVVHAHTVIGRGATIGADAVLHARVSVREGCTLGTRVVVQDGAVIGADGFGFVTDEHGIHHKIAQRATVVIEDDVEIGANTAIDRPAVGETRIGRGTKIDNLVQIAHGVRVGEHTLLAAQVGIAGSSQIGSHVVLAGQVGVAGHLTIGDGVKATAQTGIPNSIEAGAFVSGYPAIDNRDWLKSSAVFRRLPELKKQVHDLLYRLEALERQLPAAENQDGLVRDGTASDAHDDPGAPGHPPKTRT
jgi:UDP-3-O-[3-hydroxymyristoyl] glucosamine N-acyltransferase